MEGLVGNIKICTLNVRGIRNKQKRYNIFSKLKKSKYDIMAMQETHMTDQEKKLIDEGWGENYHFCKGTNRSKGLITLFSKKIKKENTEIVYSKERIIVSKIKIGESHIYVINVYGPCNESEKFIFMDNIKKELEKIKQDNHIILLGDFNIVMSNENDIVAGFPHKEKIVRKLNENINELGLSDIWRLRNNGRKSFSWSSSKPFTARRLDYIFLSEELVNFCNKIKMEEFGYTDHKVVEIECNFNKLEKGPGYYKFNTSLLHNVECVNEIKQEIMKAENLDLDPHLKLEYVKIKIKSAGITHGKLQAKQKNKEKLDIKTKLKIIENRIENELTDENDIVEYNKLKQRLEIIEIGETEGARLRAGQKWIEEGEKCNKFFLNLEKQRAEDNTISKLYDNDKKKNY